MVSSEVTGKDASLTTLGTSGGESSQSDALTGVSSGDGVVGGKSSTDVPSELSESAMDVDEDNVSVADLRGDLTVGISLQEHSEGSSPATLGGDSDGDAGHGAAPLSHGKKRARARTESGEEARPGNRGARSSGTGTSRRGNGRSRGR